MNTEELQYPIGYYEPRPFSENQKEIWLDDLRFLPQSLERAIENLDADQLHSPYREGGWTIHQLVHHVADSHVNAYTRFKLGLTENLPTIKYYEEKEWANLADVKALPVNVSITLLYSLHSRWVEAIKWLTPEEWQRAVFYPGKHEPVTLWYLLGNYSWHGRHHVAHINRFRQRNHF